MIKCKDYSVSLKDLISGGHDKHVIEQCSLGQTAQCYRMENLAAATNACNNLISFSYKLSLSLERLVCQLPDTWQSCRFSREKSRCALVCIWTMQCNFILQFMESVGTQSLNRQYHMGSSEGIH